MNDDHVPSSPHFFRPVGRTFAAWLVVLLTGAAFLPAPLQKAADPEHAPNPAKAAWFLLWIQELVSHGNAWIAAVLALAVLTAVLPVLRRAPIANAAWFRRGERLLAVASGAIVLAVVVLTVIAMFFRSEQWRLAWPS